VEKRRSLFEYQAKLLCLFLNTYYFEVEVIANHYVSWFKIAMADLESAVKILEEDD